MIRFLFKLIRLAFLLVLGAAVAGKFLLESHAEPETQEIDLVNIFGGQNLVSSASPFHGGKITTLFAGTVLDLRKSRPAPTGIYLDAVVAFAGLQLVVPPGWKVVFDGQLIGGGFQDGTRPVDDPDAPVVRVGGLVFLGGVAATTRSQLEAAI